MTTTSNSGFWVIDAGNSLTGGAYDITLVGEGIQGIADLCDLTAIKRVNMGNWFESGTHQMVTGTIARPVLQRTGASGWSNWGFGGGSLNPLPINLINFSVSCSSEGDVISWQTANASDDDFEIQSSKDGKTWATTGRVKGNNQSIYTYRVSNVLHKENKTFYRLVQKDNSGHTNISSIKATSCPDANRSIFALYPNPASNVLNIESSSEIGQIEIYNSKGQIVFEGNFPQNKIDIGIQDFTSGLYILKTDNQTLRFIKY